MLDLQINLTSECLWILSITLTKVTMCSLSIALEISSALDLLPLARMTTILSSSFSLLLLLVDCFCDFGLMKLSFLLGEGV